MPDGVNLAVLIHQLSAQMRGSRHFILEAVQLILQSLEAGCLSLAQMLLIAAHLHWQHQMWGRSWTIMLLRRTSAAGHARLSGSRCVSVVSRLVCTDGPEYSTGLGIWSWYVHLHFLRGASDRQGLYSDLPMMDAETLCQTLL